jgi:hypothetical protein
LFLFSGCTLCIISTFSCDAKWDTLWCVFSDWKNRAFKSGCPQILWSLVVTWYVLHHVTTGDHNIWG